MAKIQKRGIGQKSTSLSIFGYKNGRSFVAGMQKQSEGDYTGPSYFRSGFPELDKIETQLANLVGVPKNQLYFMSSGMSAVVAALEITSPTKGDIVIHGTAEYSKIDVYIEEDLKERGVKTFTVNPGNIKNIDILLKRLAKNNSRSKVKAIIFETVGNGPAMPVLNLQTFLKLNVLRQLDALIILDNTLATNSVVKLSEHINKNPDLKIVGIESATKFYLNNQDLGGIIFTPKEEIRKKILHKRTRLGLVPGFSLVEKFSDNALTKQEFTKEIYLSIYNTFCLARACAEVAVNGKVSIGYPNLPDHPNYKYASQNYPKGIAPVFFLQPLPKSHLTSEELFYRLDREKAFEGIEITESFGFLSTTTYHNTRYGGYIRFAGGIEAEKELKQKANRLKSALSKI